ncbi:MAG TPA: hypothetical protein VIR78_11850 [Malonomonas sp.]
MDLPEELKHKTIGAMLAEHPQLVEILKRYKIDCVACGSTSCLFKNVIATHAYDPKQAAMLEDEINAYLNITIR